MKNCLIWIVQFYRKHLSHTVCKHMKCFFSDTCSTYTLRLLKTQKLIPTIKLLYWHLRKGRCGCYTLYDIRGYLCWAEGYDHLSQNLNDWVTDMRENKKEKDSTIQRILSNFYHILCYQNQLQKAEEVKQLLDEQSLCLNCYLLKLDTNFFQKFIHRRIALFLISVLTIICALLTKYYILFALGAVLLFWIRKTARRENLFYKRYLNATQNSPFQKVPEKTLCS